MMKIVTVVEELGGMESMDDFKTCVQSIYLLIVLGILTSFTQNYIDTSLFGGMRICKSMSIGTYLEDCGSKFTK